MTSASFDVFDEQVWEPGDVAWGLENSMRGHTRSIDFQHFLLQDKMLAPDLFNVSLDGAAYWAEVVETSAATINLKALEHHESSFEEIVE